MIYKPEHVPLNSICEIGNGYAFKSEDFLTSGIPLLRISNIENERVSFNGNAVYLEESKLSKHENFVVKKGDVVIALSGATTGKYGIYLLDQPCLLNQRIGIIRSGKSEKLDSKYFYFYLSILQSKIFSEAQGAAQPNISTKDIGSMEIPLPPLAEQQKIAAILDAADSLRQKDQQLVEHYTALSQSLFLDMFGDPVANPMGWDIKTIDQLVHNKKGAIKRGPFGGALKKEIFVEDGFLVYEQFHALNNDFSMARYFIDEKKFNELKGFEVEPDDIIISCSGVNLGRLAVVPKNARRGIMNQALLKITLDSEIMANVFFTFVFTNKNFKEKFFGEQRGSGVPNFPPISTFKQFEFICPPIDLQNQFAERITLIEAQKQQAQVNLEKSEALFNSLSQQAFTSELICKNESSLVDGRDFYQILLDIGAIKIHKNVNKITPLKDSSIAYYGINVSSHTVTKCEFKQKIIIENFKKFAKELVDGRGLILGGGVSGLLYFSNNFHSVIDCVTDLLKDPDFFGGLGLLSVIVKTVDHFTQYELDNIAYVAIVTVLYRASFNTDLLHESVVKFVKTNCNGMSHYQLSLEEFQIFLNKLFSCGIIKQTDKGNWYISEIVSFNNNKS